MDMPNIDLPADKEQGQSQENGETRSGWVHNLYGDRSCAVYETV